METFLSAIVQNASQEPKEGLVFWDVHVPFDVQVVCVVANVLQFAALSVLAQFVRMAAALAAVAVSVKV